ILPTTMFSWMWISSEPSEKTLSPDLRPVRDPESAPGGTVPRLQRPSEKNGAFRCQVWTELLRKKIELAPKERLLNSACSGICDYDIPMRTMADSHVRKQLESFPVQIKHRLHLKLSQ
ncbi:mCG1042157, partial [Mus musculus]